MTPPRLATAGDGPVDLFSVLRERDVLVHHPYDSFTTSVEAFITQAADDPNVLAIKQTLYRTSDDTAIVSALVRAAEQGKQVAALVEVKARFDEQANIVWARQLERAGVHVVYGLVGLKTHSKIALVVRREEDGLRRYCHIGTGNYNSETAKVYEDLGLSDRRSRHRRGPDRPVQPPDRLRPAHHLPAHRGRSPGHAAVGPRPDRRGGGRGRGGPDHHQGERAHRPGGHRRSLRRLAGGRPDRPLVRGVCCLRPGVPGLSERITVRSIMGRFLEHSRIYRFGDPGRRTSGALHDRLRRLWSGTWTGESRSSCPCSIPSCGLGSRRPSSSTSPTTPIAWELGPDGDWVRVVPVLGLSAQRRLQELALERARRRRSPEPLN